MNAQLKTTNESSINRKIKKQKKPLGFRMIKGKYLIIMALPAVIWSIIFCYIPVYGWLMGFQNYNPGLGILKSEWVGLSHFVRFFTDPQFFNVMRNTVVLSSLNIIGFTIFPILFALLLSELGNLKYKKTIQTISYLPHFVSYVVVANLFLTLLSPSNGIVNNILMNIGIIEKPINYFALPKLWWYLITSINIWKETGWSAIIYLASIAGIKPVLYEAATIDGANRLQRIIHITIPGIIPTIVVLLILSVPDVLNAGFDPSYLLGNPIVSDYSEVLDLYLYNKGLKYAQYSFATAVGILRSVIGLVLVVGANKLSRSISEYGIY